MPDPAKLLVRTDGGALVTGSILFALLVLEVVRAGLVMSGQNDGSIDKWVVISIFTGTLYAGAFAIGHAWMRKSDLRARYQYAILGALVAVPPYLIAMGMRPIVLTAQNGTLSVLLSVPLVCGAILGFLYHKRAGYDRDGG